MKCSPLSRTSLAICISSILLLAFIFHHSGNGSGTYPWMNQADRDSVFRGLIPKDSKTMFTLSQSKWSCENKTEIKERNLDCRRRLPDVIGIGSKKCGTAALRFFLGSHPAVAVHPTEVHQWDKHPTRSIEVYRNQMPITSQFQITMEKTPKYFVEDNIPAAIARDISPNLKLLLMLRDPVKRAISDYTHVLMLANRLADDVKLAYPPANVPYIIKKTFKKSVLNEDGTVNIGNAIIFTGLYARHLRNWFKVFPREQILILDGDLFSKDPLPQLQAIESFLGLPKYFDANKIYLDEAKGFFCLAVPFKQCMDDKKGRQHPDVDRDTLTKLYKFYEPYDKELKILTGRKFSWMKP